MQKVIRIKRLENGNGLKAPEQANAYDAGYDFRSTIDHRLHPGNGTMIPTGFAIEIPVGWVGLLFPRSSWGRRGIVLQNTVGVIDSTYRGEVKLAVKNESDDALIIRAGDALAQMVIVPCLHLPLIEVESLSETERGAGGFGSTGA